MDSNFSDLNTPASDKTLTANPLSNKGSSFRGLSSKTKEESATDLDFSPEEYLLCKRMIEHLPTGLLKGGSFSKFLFKLRKYKRSVSAHQYKRLTLILMERFLSGPFRLIDKQYESRIRNTKISHPPIFILGVYRSGTTHLHNLMSVNDSLSHITNQQVANPESFLSGTFLYRHLAKIITPKERPLDAMKVTPDTPQEHQFAMLNLMTPTYSDFFLFPSRYQEFLDLSVIHTLPQALQQEWKQKFMFLLQKLTYFNHGKQLVLKNPHDTANISTLLALFPEAKFIFIHRKPEEVMPSLINMIRAMSYGLQLEGKTFKKIDAESIRYFQHTLTPMATEAAFMIYKILMTQYFEDKHLIPKDKLIELSYDTLTQQPYAMINHIHDQLNISRGPAFEPALKKYLASQNHYKVNKFSPLPQHILARIQQELSPLYEKLGDQATHEF